MMNKIYEIQVLLELIYLIFVKEMILQNEHFTINGALKLPGDRRTYGII